jgi:hypothetical protein
MPLFRVEARPGAARGLLGYRWVEVLAIEPAALAIPSKDYGEWCERVVVCDYICLTEGGLMIIRSSDFWAAVEDYKEYDEMTPQDNPPYIVVTTGHSSVVQTGGYISGGVATGANVGVDLADIPMEQLATELFLLRGDLIEKAESANDYQVIGAVAEAEDAALSEDRGKVIRALSRVGRSALQGARDIGVEVAAAAISRSMGGA